MPCTTKWTNLTRANKVIFVLTVVALSLLVFGFSTPLWILISVKTEFNFEAFEMVEKEYIGLWQWCFKHYGCFDLSFLAKQFSIFTKINKSFNLIDDVIINKANRIINLWTISRSCATVAVVCAISFSIWKLYFIWIREMNHVRVYYIVSIVENFIIGPALCVCLITFSVAIQTYDELKMNIYNGLDINEILHKVDIHRYFFISFWMVCAATILYFSNGILAIVTLCRSYVINTKAASGRRSVAATKSGNEKSLEMIYVYNS